MCRTRRLGLVRTLLTDFTLSFVFFAAFLFRRNESRGADGSEKVAGGVFCPASGGGETPRSGGLRNPVGESLPSFARALASFSRRVRRTQLISFLLCCFVYLGVVFPLACIVSVSKCQGRHGVL